MEGLRPHIVQAPKKFLSPEQDPTQLESYNSLATASIPREFSHFREYESGFAPHSY